MGKKDFLLQFSMKYSDINEAFRYLNLHIMDESVFKRVRVVFAWMLWVSFTYLTF